ncbi:MAG TPA: class I SAM-dependent methyltransferase [Candidatus Binatia bacterium]|jgi:SAM-dependent methyltransferase|nr:class I SAM-dependent methyltransferase [Candidatus Binatia bacterium]
MSEAPVAKLAAAVEALVRGQAVAMPPPRGLPYLGLEHASGTGFHLLDALTAHGIFRKYERVLDVGTGLGASARWLAARLGCEVLGTAADAAEAAAAAELTRRAGLAGQVRLLPAAPHALPVRERHFTHVWMIETLPRCRDPAAVLAETLRALRPGGTFALQDLVRAERAEPPPLPGWRPATTGERVSALRKAGFVEIVVHDRTSEAAERSPRVVAVRAELARRLDREAKRDPRLARLVADRAALARAVADGALRVVQIVGRRA